MNARGERGRRGGRVRAVFGATLVVGSLTSVLLASGGTAGAAPHAVTLYVNTAIGTKSTGCAGPGATACRTIQEGVSAAELLTGDDVTVTVAAGTYPGGITITAGPLSSLTIVGATGASATKVTGEHESQDFAVAGGSVTIRGLSIDQGSARWGGGVSCSGTTTLTDDTLVDDQATTGGGVYSTNCSVTLAHDTLSSDSAANGGALFNYDGTAKTTDVVFSTDLASADGGAIYNEGFYDDGPNNRTIDNESGTITLTNDTLSGDMATTGGGIYNNEGTVTTRQVDILNDVATFSGGGLFENWGTALVTHDVISTDTAEAGGGIFNYEGAATVTDATFSGDTATTGGGLYNTLSGTSFSITDVTFSNDTAFTQGGGIYNDETGTATLADVTFSTDSAQLGGGVADSGSTVTMTGITFSRDSTSEEGEGGGIYNYRDTTSVNGSIFDASSCATTTDPLTGTFNVVTTATCEIGPHDVLTTAAKIKLTTTLHANTTTSAYVTVPETLALGRTSPAINEVPKTICMSVVTDERGAPRPGDKPGTTHTTTCDAGAYELQITSAKAPPSPPTNLRATATSRTSASLTWTAPISNGGTAIKHYLVYKTGELLATLGTTLTDTAVGLAADTTYHFTVKAENTVGTSGPSNTLALRTTTTAPSPRPLPPPAPIETRVFGQTADATAGAEFTRAFPSTKGACPATRAAVVATTRTYQDALSSQFLAQSLTTGTLLTPTTNLSSVTSATLKNEGITTVYIVGGPLAIATTVARQIDQLTAYECGGATRMPTTGKLVVHRIWGETQYGTAKAVAEHVGTGASVPFAGAYATTNATGGTGRYNDTAGKGSAAPSGSGPTAILADGDEFQDAQSASVVSYHTKLPLLLTPATTLSTTAVGAVKQLGIKQVILMGGPDAITNTVEASLVEKTGVTVLRVAGKDYTDTADELARFETAGGAAGLGWTPGHRVMVTRGNGFTDGIAGAVLDSPHNTSLGPSGTTRPLLLTENPTVVGTYLTPFLKVTGHTGIGKTPGKTITTLTVLGGPLAVSTVALSAMETDLSH